MSMRRLARARSILSGGVICSFLVAACSEDDARPAYALEGSSNGSVCERAGFRCVPGGFGGCGEGTVSAGKPLGCAGEGALCCMKASDAGTDATSPDADADADAND